MAGAVRDGRGTATNAARSLAGVRIFAGLAPRELALLAAECDWQTVAKDEIVINTAQSGPPDGVMFVVDGAVRLARAAGPAGRIAYKDVGAGGGSKCRCLASPKPISRSSRAMTAGLRP